MDFTTSCPMNDPRDQTEPRSFRLSRGPSDLGALLFALAFGLLLVIAPLAARWLYRAALVAVILLMFGLIRSLRRLRATPPPRRPLTIGDHLSTALALVVLSLWVWHIAR